ncbi:hypothetical protein L3X38_036433 [Prunus dulcis]|uniref:Uncharacterized protein n=1 Tax=Prunus dulcis TaxID=3755 RepID=A0AAD4V3B4_PRUDU|nr:hypothetical protein L3X38_036433 [Prunus dulcis]
MIYEVKQTLVLESTTCLKEWTTNTTWLDSFSTRLTRFKTLALARKVKRKGWMNAPACSSRRPMQVEQEQANKENDKSVLLSMSACRKHP